MTLTLTLTKANYPAHAYVLYPRSAPGRASLAVSTEALTRANFSGKVQGASLFELLEPEGGGAIRRTRGAGGDPTRRGGGRFNRLALAELHRWPACKSRLAVAAAAAGAARLSRHSG